jgi:hypothetical protein
MAGGAQSKSRLFGFFTGHWGVCWRWVPPPPPAQCPMSGMQAYESLDEVHRGGVS